MQTYSNKELSEEYIDWPVYIRRSIELAQNAITATPNPRVGCVLVKSGSVIAEGWHVAAGAVHAEIMALESAGENAQGAVAFVSLEPCSHTGRTGPCCDALIAVGISTVVVAGIDPDPRVSGKGVKALEAAGISVFHLVDFEDVARAVNPGYFKRLETGLPYVRCKLAMSLDGRTALANGASKWITGTAARADVQTLRAGSCAVVTGIGTVLADDPAMNVRPHELDLAVSFREHNKLALDKQPLRVVLDSQLRIPDAAKIIVTAGAVKIYTAEVGADSKRFPDNVEIIAAPMPAVGKGREASVSLRTVLKSLASDYACNEVLVEAGSTLSAAFVQSGLVDELVVYIAPRLLGSDGKALLELSGIQSLADSVDFLVEDLTKVGGDIKVTLVPAVSADR